VAEGAARGSGEIWRTFQRSDPLPDPDPALAGVSPSRSLLSLLGPTIHCRGRTCTCKHVKG
jgi:hypothetical protein